MSLTSESKEIKGIVGRLCDALGGMVAQSGLAGAAMRQQIGDLRAYAIPMLKDGTFSVELYNAFFIARNIPVALPGYKNLREVMLAEEPSGLIATSIVQTAILYSLSSESRLISAMTFSSREDVDVMIKYSKAAFDSARDMAADAMDTTTYQLIIALYGSLIQHLATTQRPLPRMITFNLWTSLPVLTISNQIYQDPSRWEELVKENKIIHPAFCMRSIIGLSQ